MFQNETWGKKRKCCFLEQLNSGSDKRGETSEQRFTS